MNIPRRVSPSSVPLIIGMALLAAVMSACEQDNCVDVQCGPAPPPLKVIVTDTLSVPTRLARFNATTGAIDTIDTVIVHRGRATTDVLVTLLNEVDSVAIDTLQARDTAFYRDDVLGLEGRRMIVRAQRVNRCARQGGLSIAMTEGCCPYPVIGRFVLGLNAADTCR